MESVATSKRRILRRAACRLLAVVLVAGVVAVQGNAEAEASPTAPAISTVERTFLTLLNTERVQRGLPALTHDAALANTSRAWSNTMRQTGSFRHDPNLRTRVRAVEPAATAWAENIGQGSSASYLHSRFMASTSHRANILSSRYNRVGIGVVQVGSTMWVTVRFLQGPAKAGPTGLGCSGSRVESVAVADLDDNGADDLTVNRVGTGCDAVLAGSSTGTFHSQPVVIGGSYIPVAGDFDGDGKANVLWYEPGTASDYLSKWSGTKFNSIPQQINGSYEPFAGDFDGDGRDDILWYAAGPTGDYIWYGTSTYGRFDSRPLTVNGHYEVVVTDLDGDGRDDVLWYGPGTAPDYVHYSTRRGRYSSVAVVINGRYQPVAGDFDGDSRGDVLWYAPGTPDDYVWYGHGRRGSYDSRHTTINGTYNAVSGDFNGDGRADIAWLRSEPEGSPIWFGRSVRGRYGQSTIRVV